MDRNKLLPVGGYKPDVGKQKSGDAVAISAVSNAWLDITCPVGARPPVSGEGALPLFQWSFEAAGPLEQTW